MRNVIWPATLLATMALAGCGKTVDSDTNAAGCDNSVVSVFPADKEPNAYYRSPIEVKFADVDDSATIAITDGSGTAVTGKSEWRDKTLVFTPDAPLAPKATYNVAISFCGGNPATSFTTSEVGGTVDSASLPGRTYSLDLKSGRFVQPEGVGDLLQQYLTTQVLVGVQSVDGTQIQMIGALATADSDPPTQDMCSESIPFPAADFSANPYFQVGPQTTTISVSDYDITITDLMISGAFSPDGSYIEGAVLAGSIDTRPLVPLLDDSGDPDAICKLAQSIGVSCEACSTDGQPYCLSLYVDSINATAVDGLTLQELTTTDICGDGGGNPGTCPDDASCQPDTGSTN